MNKETQQPRRRVGRPRIHLTDTAAMNAHRDSQKKRRAREIAERSAWLGIRDAARQRGTLDGTETEPEAMAKVISKMI